MAKMVNIGFGNFLDAERTVAVMTPDTAQIKRIIAKAREDGKFLDASHARRTRSVIVTDSGFIIMSGLTPATVADRISKSKVDDVEDKGEKKSDKKRTADDTFGSKRDGQRYGLQEIT